MALDLGTLKIGIEVDDKQAKSQLQSFSGDVESTGKDLKSKFASIAKGAGKALKVGLIAGCAAAAAALTKISKEALNLYGSFEQLEGGIQTLFGDAAQDVMNNANNAWKAAGMSVNDYMETSIQSAAAMINSLGGDQKKAAELSNQAIIDMSDNVNKMGTTMEAVQNAYRGFSRGNFTMLDNLALGFAGTKEGMQELLDKAEEISGIKFDINSYSDIVQAIHEVQNEMGITGTTAKEALETIEGSVNATKAAWQNLLTGLGNEDADIEKLVDDVISSAGAALKNIVPRLGTIIKAAIKALGSTVKQLASKAAENAAGEAGDKLFAKIKALPGKLLDFIIDTINSISEYLENSGGSALASKAGEVLSKVITTLIKKAPALVAALLRLLTMLFQRGVEAIAKAVLGIFTGLLESIKKLWDSLKRKVAEKLKPSIDTGALGAFIEKCKQVKDWWDSVKKKLSEKATAHAEQKTTGGDISGGTVKHRVGLREVPYDNYQATLHKGEAILTAAEANQYNRAIGRIIADEDLVYKRTEKQTPINNTENITHYNFGDITLDVRQLEDIVTVEQFVNLMKQAKAFV